MTMPSPDVEVAVDVAVPPDAVWALLADPTRMGEFSPECRRVTWVGDVRETVVGARFRGVNRRGPNVWATASQYVEVVPGRRVAWESRFLGLPVSRWQYDVEPGADGGTRVVESWWDQRHTVVRAVGPVARLTLNAAEHNRRGMAVTLGRIKARLEG
jgi:uncharacterized protein YndB with AHSA1/START domain